MKPSQEIKLALEGALPIDDITPASLSNMRLMIYKIACQVLALPKNMMANEINKHPEGIRPLIKAECRRIYNCRGMI